MSLVLLSQLLLAPPDSAPVADDVFAPIEIVHAPAPERPPAPAPEVAAPEPPPPEPPRPTATRRKRKSAIPTIPTGSSGACCRRSPTTSISASASVRW